MNSKTTILIILFIIKIVHFLITFDSACDIENVLHMMEVTVCACQIHETDDTTSDEPAPLGQNIAAP